MVGEKTELFIENEKQNILKDFVIIGSYNPGQKNRPRVN